jgi:hypothetical protein
MRLRGVKFPKQSSSERNERGWLTLSDETKNSQKNKRKISKECCPALQPHPHNVGIQDGESVIRFAHAA